MTTTEHMTVETAYDRWAADYDTSNNPMVHAASHALAAGLKAVKGQDCLEFGCGTGRNLGAMAQADARTVTGIDLSPAMLEQARARNGATSPLNWTLIQHDLRQAPPLAGASANFVLFALTLEHIDDLALPLVHARRLLRHNGMIRIVEIHPFRALTGGRAHFIDGEIDVTMPTFSHQFESWIKAFKKSNLSIENLREWCAVDFGDAPPSTLALRDPHVPWLIDFTLRAR